MKKVAYISFVSLSSFFVAPIVMYAQIPAEVQQSIDASLQQVSEAIEGAQQQVDSAVQQVENVTEAIQNIPSISVPSIQIPDFQLETPVAPAVMERKVSPANEGVENVTIRERIRRFFARLFHP